MKITIFIILLAACAFAQPHFSDSAPVVFQWNANTEPDLAGYKLYWDTNSSAPYANSLSVGNVLTKSLTLAAGTYYAALTAIDNSGNESGYSSELNFIIDAGGGTPTTTDSITVKWNRPTRYDNGEILPPENISSYDVVARLYTDPDWSGATTIKSGVAPTSTNPVTAEIGISLADGTYYIGVYCYTDEGTLVRGVISDYALLTVPVNVTSRKSLGAKNVIVIPREQ